MPLIHGLGVRLAVVSVMRRRLAAARRESSFVDGIGAEHPREHLRANLPPLDLHVSIISARPLFHPSLTALAHPLSRSEEHTSELQSLMRISYAVFCLKKKTQIITS